MKESCVAAIDQGTTSTRCILFDEHARPIASSQREHEQIFPRAGWVEHDALEIWTNTQRVVRDAAAKADVDVAALGITNQRETIVLWDRTSGRPYANAIVWQDTRTRELVEQLAEHGGHDRWRERTGLPLATYFSGPKIAWLLNEHPGLRDEVQQERALCGTMESWLIWNLTGGVDGGVHVTDVTNASRTQLMNLATLDWDEEILGELELPRALLPRIVSNGDRDGWGTTDLFGSAVPVCAAIGDQQGALVGQGCFARGDAKNTYGTGCFLLANTGTEPVLSDAGLLTTLGYRLPGERAVYALEGSVAVAGSLVQWLRDNLGLFEQAHEVEELASRAEDSGGMYIVPAFSGLFAPHWRSDARGVFVGLTRFIDKSHIARAALEATCFQTRDVLEAMRHDTGADFDVLRVDGGMVVNELLMQFQADVLGTPVARPVVAETTSLGSAYVAGLAKDFFPPPEEFRTAAREARRWTPVMGEDERERRYAGWKRAIERSLNWVD